MMTNIIRSGKLRADKVLYKDGIGCTVWYPFEENGDEENAGICFDFSYEDIDDFIVLLQKVKEAEAEIFVDSE